MLSTLYPQWLEADFLGYLNEWKLVVIAFTDASDAMKRRMHASAIFNS
jgi:hypothetical protein